MTNKEMLDLMDEIRSEVLSIDYSVYVWGFWLIVDSKLKTFYISDFETTEFKPIDGELWVHINVMESLWKTKDTIEEVRRWLEENHLGVEEDDDNTQWLIDQKDVLADVPKPRKKTTFSDGIPDW